MSITDELREYANKVIHREDYMAGLAFDLNRIADRIDEAIASEYVRLPRDADGVPIRVGDVMEVKFEPKRKPFAVSFVGERSVAFWVDGQPDLKSINLDNVLVIHHHEPTVEDVLRDVVTLCHNTWKEGSITGLYDVDDVMNSGNIAEFAKRIREVVE